MSERKKTQIGWFILKKEHEFTNTYECAAWYENVMVQPGKYPLYVYDYKERETKQGKEVTGHIDMAYAYLPGVITSDEFGARFCGVPVGSYDNYKNKGKESSYTFSQYLYAIADSILKEDSIYYSDKWEYELLPMYKAKPFKFTSYDGKVIDFQKICVKGD